MSYVEWLALAGLCFLGAASPGPSVAVVMAQTLSGGRSQGAIVALAHGVGVGVYALLAALGLAVIVQQTPWLFDGLRGLGAAFLLFLAYRAFRAPATFDDGTSRPGTWQQAATTGFLTAFLNPKLAIFFLAVYTQFVTAQTSLGTKLGMVAITAVVDTLWYLGVVLMVGHPAVMQKLRSNAGLVQRVFGALLLLVAVRIVWN